METQNLTAKMAVLAAVPTENPLTTTLTITNVSADEIDVDYGTMPGNQPNTYGNFLAIWQNANSIPWNSDPDQTFLIQTNTPSGSAAFTKLNVTNNDYIIGYAVGAVLTAGGAVQKYGNICATAYIPKASDGSQGTIFTPSISGFNVGATSLSFQFDLPQGISPAANGAWAGLWRGTNPAFYSSAPQSFISLPDYASGRAAFNNVSIGRGLTYTVGIFMSGYKSGGTGSTQRALACSASFTN